MIAQLVFASRSVMITGMSILLRSLLVDIRLNTTLKSLACVVLVLVCTLCFRVAGQTCNSTTDSAGDTIGDTLAKVTELTLCLLTLALSILLLSLALQSFSTNKAAKSFLC